MSGRYRYPAGSTVALALIAFGVWTALVWSLANQHSHRTRYTDYATGQSAEYARQEIETVCSREAAPSGYVECAERVLGTERDNRRSDYDLEAQQDMAQWAFVLVAITAGQAVIGGIGLYLLIGTFRQTAIQAHAAQRASAKSTVANVIARENAKSERRPWLKIAAGPSEGGGFISQGALNPRIKFEIKNLGQTPAFDVVDTHIVRSAYGAIAIKTEIAKVIEELRSMIDVGLFEAIIVPDDTGTAWSNKALPIEEAAYRTDDDGDEHASAIIVFGVAFRTDQDKTPRFSVQSYVYTFFAPKGEAARGYVLPFLGGSFMS